MVNTLLLDKQWAKSAFIIPAEGLASFDIKRRTENETYFKFTDTTPGGNWVINPPSQPCQNTDPNEDRLFENDSKGMGIWYSSVIDNNMEVLTLRMGVPQFTGMANFFTHWTNSEIGATARTGYDTGMIYEFCDTIGGAIQLLLPFAWLSMAKTTFDFFLGKPNSRYYSLRPAMYLYNNTVNTAVNMIAQNLGLVVGGVDSGYNRMGNDSKVKTDGKIVNFDGAGNLQEGSPKDVATKLTNYINRYSNMLPDVYMANGGINVAALNSRVQRKQDIFNSQLTKYLTNLQRTNDYRDVLRKQIEGTSLTDNGDDPYNYTKYISQSKAINKMLFTEGNNITIQAQQQADANATANSSPYSVNTIISDTGETNTNQQELSNLSSDPSNNTIVSPDAITGMNSKSMIDRFLSYLEADMHDGDQFVSFAVDFIDTVSQGVSNSTQQSDIAESINSATAARQATRYDLMDGQTGTWIDTITNSIASAVGGFAHGIGLDSLVNIFTGTAFADIPDFWSSATMDLPRTNVTIKLRSDKGDALSYLQKICIPLTSLMAAAYPRSVGSQSYTSPFICEYYIQGKMQSRLAIIDSLSWTTGGSPTDWSYEGLPLAVDVSLSIRPLSNVMCVPMSASVGPLDVLNVNELVAKMLSSDTSWSDWIAVMSGMGLDEQIYVLPGFKRRWNYVKMGFKESFTTANTAMWVRDSVPGRTLSAFMTGTGRGF